MDIQTDFREYDQEQQQLEFLGSGYIKVAASATLASLVALTLG